MQNSRTGKQARKESNEWLGEESNEDERPELGKVEKSIECQKHSPKEQRTSPVEKTQRIKKPKKQERKINNRQQPAVRPENQTLEDRLVCQSVNRLRGYQSTQPNQTLPIFKRLTRERLIDFLELIEQQYSQTVKAYLSNASNQKSCGNLKSLFICFIDQIAEAFPVLNNIVYQYAFRYYATGPLQYRFSKLMEKNITPILKLMSEKYNKVQKRVEVQKQVDFQSSSTHVSQSPQREHLEEFQEIDAKKMEKRRKKRNKKKEKQGEEAVDKEGEAVAVTQLEQKPLKVEIDRSVLELNNFLDQLIIDDTTRTPCRIDQTYLNRWKPPQSFQP